MFSHSSGNDALADVKQQSAVSEEPEAVAKGPAIFQHNLQPPDKEVMQKYIIRENVKFG